MITQLKLTLLKTQDMRISYNISSLLQGVIMEMVSNVYGQKMHESNLKPYSQYIEMKKEEIIWCINTVTSEAKEEIIIPFLAESIREIEIKHKEWKLPIVNRECVEQTYQNLISATFFGNGQRRVTVLFASPTAFKSNGEFVLYPSVRLVFQSLMNKFDAFSTEATIGSEELLSDIEKNVRIIDYRLRSYRFHLEGNFVPAFLGEITLGIKGPQQLVNVVEMLLRFGEYSGIGVKAAIGMGGIKIVERRPRNEARNN